LPTEKKRETAAAVGKKVVAKKTATKKATAAKKTTSSKINSIAITFQVRFHTTFGQELFVMGNHPLLGDNDVNKAVPLSYLSEDFWSATMAWPADTITAKTIIYNYVLRNADGTTIIDWGSDKQFSLTKNKHKEYLFIDTWNHAGYTENTFYADAFKHILLRTDKPSLQLSSPKTVTHRFRVKTPLLGKDQTLCIIGSTTTLGNWDISNPILLDTVAGTDYYEATVDLTKATFPVAYKYGVYNTASKSFVGYEEGNNRFIYDTISKGKQTIINDGYAYLTAATWKGAGVAIPVFSLRTNKGLGVGEFTDIKELVDWAVTVGLKLIQILPINDTTATHGWKDSYPYAAISAFALHPIYINLEAVAGKDFDSQLKKLAVERKKLNALSVVDYDAIIQLKERFLKEVYQLKGAEVLETADFKNYFEQNKHWLLPYAVFCYLRDEYGTVDFNKWPAYKKFNTKEVTKLADVKSKAYADIAFHYFVQYHLHLQLKEATLYAHSKGIIVKGDVAIGVYRYGADTWQQPELYHMDFQAGAPPDDFAVKGQNWGFPTYNWKRMQEDGFTWWKQRFAQMSYYFDAFRIDHILGFFRIWSIPLDAVEGIMGYFVPALPVHINEFNQQHIWFDYGRYTKPYITDQVLWNIFGYDNELVKDLFLDRAEGDTYILKPAFNTQRKVEDHFALLEQDEHHTKIKKGLFDLISNVILFDINGDGQHFHFRFGIEHTTSFQYLASDTQQQLKELYVNYFFRRQDDFWMKEAMQKLPALKRVTNMIVCGEDLGLVPACVPDVMKQLGLLSLEIQRMPKDAKREFFHPNDAPYLSVVTPSTHDMSTIRGWWEEDKAKIQRFYNQELGQWGDAPFYCEAWINKSIVVQHLYSPAMWSIFQLQDIMGIDEEVRRENPDDERINVPANHNHYWQYRMHKTVGELMQAKAFNETLLALIKASGR
jgi:4-alpha-glucanotransferase